MVSENSLNEVFTCMKTHVIDYLKKTPKYACVTFDAWTDRYRHTSYLIYTHHYIDNWELKCIVLKTTAFPYRHLGINIKAAFEEMLDEFELNDKVISLVTDSGANMVLAAQLLELPRSPCLAHRIQSLIMSDMLEDIRMNTLRRIIQRLRVIQKALLYSNHKLKKIADEQFQSKYVEWLSASDKIGIHSLTSHLFNLF